MDGIREFLSYKLMEIGIEKEALSDFKITTAELGLSSLEYIDMSLDISKRFGIPFKLERKTETSLEDICKMIEEMVDRNTSRKGSS